MIFSFNKIIVIFKKVVVLLVPYLDLREEMDNLMTVTMLMTVTILMTPSEKRLTSCLINCLANSVIQCSAY